MNKNSEKVSIILLNYRLKDVTIECLESVSRLDYDNFEVIIADNSPEQEQIQEEDIRDICPETTIIKNKTNAGFAGGCNPGIRKALEGKSDFIWLLNNDTIPDESALTELVKTITSAPEIGAAGSAIYDIGGTEIQTYGGGRINLLKVYTVPNLSENTRLDFITGASMLIRREALEQCGLLDEKFFMYFEDSDFSVRLSRHGWKLAVAPESKIRHHEGASSKGLSEMKEMHSIRSAYRFASKHSPIPLLSYLLITQTRLTESVRRGGLKSLLRTIRILFRLAMNIV